MRKRNLHRFTIITCYANFSLILQRNLLSLNASNNNLGCVLRDHLIVVQHLKLLRRVLAHVAEERLGTTWVLVNPVGDIHDNTLDRDPEILLLVVLGHLLEAELLLGNGELLDVVGLGDLAGVAESPSAFMTGPADVPVLLSIALCLSTRR